ncbi:MAG: enoyl-CoA hydratase/isomerase family protein [Pyrinomonadaceae bacterium]
MSNALIVKNLHKAIIIQFNRPKIRSPLSIFVLNELHKILNEISADAVIETIIFTGKDDVFASGADLREIAAITKDTAREFAWRGQNLMNRINASEKETIAAINGFCFGGALNLALACDKRIASPNAVFSHPGVNLGIITGWGGTQRLPRLVGEAKALEMFLTAKRVDSGEALRIGLIDKIAENPLAESIANYPVNSSSISL